MIDGKCTAGSKTEELNLWLFAGCKPLSLVGCLPESPAAVLQACHFTELRFGEASDAAPQERCSHPLGWGGMGW